jgi:hypothetical protein
VRRVYFEVNMARWECLMRVTGCSDAIVDNFSKGIRGKFQQNEVAQTGVRIVKDYF